MLLTLPGLPALYTGDEVGAAYLPYEDVDPISWDDPGDLQTWYAKLISLRHRKPALRSSAIQWLYTEPADGVLAYPRGNASTGRILVLLNYGTMGRTPL